MEDLERLVAGRLRALDGAGPSPDVQERVLRQVGVHVTKRRRRRRALQSAAGASFMVAAVVCIPLLLEEEPSPGTRIEPAAPLAASHGIPTETVESLGQGRESGTKNPGRHSSSAGGVGLPGGHTLSALALGEDGSLLGVGESAKGDDDGTLWKADLKGLLSAPVPVAKSKDIEAAAGGQGMTLWAARGNLMCQNTAGETVQLGDKGLATDSFHVDRDTVVWTDETGKTVWTAKGCEGEPRPLTTGHAAGFAYPYAYVMQDGGEEVQQIDLENGTEQSRPLPKDVLEGEEVLFTAGQDTFSVTDHEELVVFDSQTWQSQKISDGLGSGGRARLTAGDDLVVYSTRSASLIYDVSSAKTRRISGDALTKGSWLLTREAGAYKLQKTS